MSLAHYFCGFLGQALLFLHCFIPLVIYSLLEGNCYLHAKRRVSTIFLMGPMNQLKRMFQETRIFAAVFMLVSLVLTIIFALLGLRLLCLIFCILQSLALTWYSLSYIPFARDAVKRLCSSCIG
ncbi:unnamed protein product [Heterobilharzia americana]|nr:unnamed protein product [Heterobilharzia americana]